MKNVADIIYSGYEQLLEDEIRRMPVPYHVAIIMDGNRRYAQKLGLMKYYGHLKGADTTENVLDWSFDIGIKQLTVYAFSTENFARSEEERQALLDLIGLKFDKICEDKRTHKRRMHVRALGDIDVLPRELKTSIRRAEEITRNYDGVYLNVALAYGGRQELINAARTIARKIREKQIGIDDIDEKTISEHLYPADGQAAPAVDLIIRTGGDERTSNFLPWQANGNECAAYFCAPYWPEFRKIDFLRAIRTYQTRETERQKNTVLRIVKLLSPLGQVEAEQVIKLTRRIINLPNEEILRILKDLSKKNLVMHDMIKW